MRYVATNTLRDVLRSRRLRVDWLALQVAEKESATSHWVNGRRSCSALVAARIAEALDVPIDQLFKPASASEGVVPAERAA